MACYTNEDIATIPAPSTPEASSGLTLKHGTDYYVGYGDSMQETSLIFINPSIIDLVQDSSQEHSADTITEINDSEGTLRAIEVPYKVAFSLGREALEPIFGGKGITKKREERIALVAACVASNGVVSDRVWSKRIAEADLEARSNNSLSLVASS